MTNDLVIVGSGGLAREVRSLIRQCAPHRYTILGHVGPVNNEESDILMNDADLKGYSNELNVVFAVGNPSRVAQIHSELSHNYKLIFPNIIHPSVVFFDDVTIGQGNVFFPFSVVSAKTSIGDANIFYPHCYIGHDSTVGHANLIAAHCGISGGVTIGDSCFLGTGSRILPGLTLHNSSTLGAGAVLTRSSDRPNETYKGIPARS